MSDYTVTLEGTEELLQNLRRIDSGIRQDVAVRAVNAGGIQIENKARMNAPVLTGALRNSVTTIAKSTGHGAEAEIGFRGLVYARIQEFGGTITPKKGKYLTFRTKNGNWVRARSVKIRGKHYLEKAINSEKGLAVKAMSDVVKAYLER